MKTKAFYLSFLVAMAIGVSNCKQECEPKIAACNDTVPTGDCTAYFESWIYNAEKNKCEFIGYSGCTEAGFETEEECQECKCD